MRKKDLETIEEYMHIISQLIQDEHGDASRVFLDYVIAGLTGGERPGVVWPNNKELHKWAIDGFHCAERSTHVTRAQIERK